MYLSLARKYRPKSFADVAVQSHVANTLKGAIARGRVAHGYLLCGPRGVGKTTLARVLAMALNCDKRGAARGASDESLSALGTGASAPSARASDESLSAEGGEPCGQCASCVRIWSGSASLDVVEIDAASNRGVDDARELRERAMYAPSTDTHYKVYIVDEAHMLTREAWNALLKVLEEPPPRVVFVFATTEPQKIAQAAAPVLSRLQRFDFKRIGQADVRERLATVLAAEGVDWDPDALAVMARAADGSMRDALSLADQVLSLGDGRLTTARVRDALGLVAEDEYIAMLELVANQRAGEIFTEVSRLSDAGVDLGVFLSGFADVLRAQLSISLGGTVSDLSEHTREALSAGKGRLSPADLLRMLTAATELEPHFRRSGQQQLLLETLLVRFALLDRSVSLEDVIRGIGGAGSASTKAGLRSPAVQDRPARVETLGTPADAPRAADSKAPTVPMPVELNRLVEKWGDVTARVRENGRAMLATAVDHALPVAVTARGEVTVELDDPNEIHERAIEAGANDLLAAVCHFFAGAKRITLRRRPLVTPGDPVRRLTEQGVKDERLAMLRKRDPVLDAAVDALDLELLD